MKQLNYTKLAMLFYCFLAFGLNTLMADNSVIPFQYKNGLIIVEASVDQHMGNFILDTGSEEVLINGRGLSGKVDTYFDTLNGETASSKSTVKNLQLGSIQISDVEAYSLDLQGIEKLSGVDIMGVIGCKALIPHIINIDFTTRSISFHQSYESFDFDLGVREAIHISMANDQIFTEVQLNGETYKFLLDSGASAHLLDVDVVQKMRSGFKVAYQTELITASGDPSQTNVVTTSLMQIGNQSISNPHFLVKDFGLLGEDSKDNIAGILSISKLGYNQVIIDLTQHAMYVK